MLRNTFFTTNLHCLHCCVLINLVAEATGLDHGEDVIIRGTPWIKSNYLVWGQPLSLSEEMISCNMFPKALVGESTLEPESLCKF